MIKPKEQGSVIGDDLVLIAHGGLRNRLAHLKNFQAKSSYTNRGAPLAYVMSYVEEVPVQQVLGVESPSHLLQEVTDLGILQPKKKTFFNIRKVHESVRMEYYDNQDFLAFAALCFVYPHYVKKFGNEKVDWEAIARGTKCLLGENPLKDRIYTLDEIRVRRNKQSEIPAKPSSGYGYYAAALLSTS